MQGVAGDMEPAQGSVLASVDASTQLMLPEILDEFPPPPPPNYFPYQRKLGGVLGVEEPSV